MREGTETCSELLCGGGRWGDSSVKLTAQERVIRAIRPLSPEDLLFPPRDKQRLFLTLIRGGLVGFVGRASPEGHAHVKATFAPPEGGQWASFWVALGAALHSEAVDQDSKDRKGHPKPGVPGTRCGQRD